MLTLEMKKLFCVAFSYLFVGLILCQTENGASAPYDAIVVGCGASGVAALSTLARAGKKVLGLEAANRIGGRVNTVEFGRGVVELGAEWIHGEKLSRVFELAVQNNIHISKQSINIAMKRSDGSGVNQTLSDELNQYCADLINSTPEDAEPIGQYITRKFNDRISTYPNLAADTDFVQEFLEYMNLVVNTYEATNDWNDATSINFEDLEGDQLWSWHVNGYRTLFGILLNKCNNGTGLPLEIKLNKEVSSIQWSKERNQSVTLKCKDGSTYAAKSVIVTVSVGVLKERYEKLFEPKLPQQKIDAIKTIQLGVADKIIFSYDTVWWPSNITYGFIWKGEDKANVPKEDEWTTKIYGFSSPMGTENAITLWVCGKTAKLVETLPEEVVKTKCTELIRKFMSPEFTVPEPSGMIRSTWYSNPLIRGSYTFDGVNVTDSLAMRAALAAPLLDDTNTPRLLFAGEATNQRHFGTVHGAVETGIREAENILNHLGTITTTEPPKSF